MFLRTERILAMNLNSVNAKILFFYCLLAMQACRVISKLIY
ncbi:hypothetical protein XNC3_1740015 [Xenorhabdus nematophila F1]|nr:hypothetical protein XNC3_1740015 [Xenorhabdus nematophila F1]CEE92396.1 hypothetical protein XNA1_2830008 [Xenorhabdus nematophila str. Anatoliense]